MLDLRNITKQFGKFKALDAVDFRVAAGEVVALVGANGAGKSTLLKVLAGLYADASYSASLEGNPLDLSSPGAALRAGIGVVYQETDLVPQFSVAENMYLGHEPMSQSMLGIRTISKREIMSRARQILRRVGLDEMKAGANVASLSIEMRQMAQIAKVLTLDPQVVLFDEPTARLSAEGREKLFSVIGQLKADGKMIVFVSHYLEEVFAVADRVVVLRDGQCVVDQSASSLDVPRLVKLMVGDVQVSPTTDPNTAGRTVLAVEQLSCQPHFEGVSFAARASEILGVTGIIGSGRHEMIRTLISERTTGGSIKIGGEEIANKSVGQVVGRYIGFVPEDRKRDGIIASRSVSENLSLPWLRDLSVAGVVPRSKVLARAKALISRLRLVCSSPSQPVSDLSGGNQQKAVLGRWLNSNLSVVLLEAPTVGVDVAGKEEIRQLIRALAAGGMSVVISTDDMWELEEITDRILVMFRGGVIAEFQTRTMRRSDLLSALSGSWPNSAEDQTVSNPA
jgi:ABC-type sugar transport system ATPase subunit